MRTAEELDPSFESFEFKAMGLEKIALEESNTPSSRDLIAGSTLKIESTLLAYSNKPSEQLTQRRLTLLAWRILKSEQPSPKAIAALVGQAHGKHPSTQYLSQRIRQPISRSSLKWILQDFTGCERVEIEENVPQFIHIPDAQRNQLGIQGSRLSKNFRIGRNIPERQQQLTIALWVNSLKNLGPNTVLRRETESLLKLLIPKNLKAKIEVVLIHPRRFRISKNQLPSRLR